MSKETKETKKYILNMDVVRRGYRAKIGEKIFLINIEEMDTFTKKVSRNQKLIILEGKNAVVSRKLEENTMYLEDLSDFEIYVLAVAGVIKSNKDIDSIIIKESKRLINSK